MFRFVATLCLFGLTSALVLTEKPAANASLISQSAQKSFDAPSPKEEQEDEKMEMVGEASDADDAEEKTEDKEEVAYTEKQEDKLSAADQKLMAETMKDEVPNSEEDEVPADAAEVKAEEMAAAAEEKEDSNEAMELPETA
mmetsp:Transcript_24940/g.57850  ORF Transcript_24940/g.57850 Transcript_24940/m.57850 type:complete len:141 (-) Transcript_24940:112-534(-)